MDKITAKQKTWIILPAAFLIGALAFVFCYNDFLYSLDSLYEDRVYQRSRGVNQNIKIIKTIRVILCFSGQVSDSFNFLSIRVCSSEKSVYLFRSLSCKTISTIYYCCYYHYF